MKKIFLTIMSLLIIVVSCEKFPTENELIGKWILLEQPDSYQTTLEFSDKYFIQSGIYYSSLYNQNIFYSDTSLYSLDKKQKYMYLTSANNLESTSSHKISLNTNRNELTIWGLSMYIPEEVPSETVFKKE